MVRKAKDSRDPLVPILMLTAHSELNHVISARDASITDFMTKPVSPSGLYKHIAAMIEHPRQFVRNQKFFGPDRRRRSEDSFDGPNRRSEQTENA
jgi:two-component system chemotaxis response regulator CheY